MLRIVVLGAGATGWLAAHVVQRVFDPARRGSAEVTVVDSGDDGASGLGTTTLPAIRSVFRQLGFDEGDLVCTADGSFRLGTRFVGWPDAAGGAYWQLFADREPCNAADTGRLWLADRSLSNFDTYAYAVGIQASLCDRLLAPRLACSRPYEAPVDYGYQLGTGGLTRYLRDRAIGRGVRYDADVAVAVDRDAQGDLCALRTRSGRIVPGDFFIDCSGSRRMLVGGVLAQPFVGLRDAPPCDRAIAIEVPVASDSPIPPYAIATAHEAGWIHEVHLVGSRAITLYYSSAFFSDEQAERALRAHGGVEAQRPSVRRTVSASGRQRCLWVRNCVAVGGAGGGVEPLVCDELDLAIAGLRELARCSASSLADPARAGRFNERVGALYDEALDVVRLHYSLSRRTDSAFWRACRKEMGVPPRVRVAAALGPAASGTQDGGPSLFGPEGYRLLLAGMGRLPAAPVGAAQASDPALARQIFRGIEKRRRQAMAASPDHAEYVRELRRESRRITPRPGSGSRSRAA